MNNIYICFMAAIAGSGDISPGGSSNAVLMEDNIFSVLMEDGFSNILMEG